MELISHHMRKRLSQRFLGKQAIGAIAMQAVYRFFDLSEDAVSGYVKFTTLFLRFVDHHHKVEAYKSQHALLQQVNNALKKIGYQQTIQGLRLL